MALHLRKFDYDLKWRLKILAAKRKKTLNQFIIDVLEREVQNDRVNSRPNN